MDRDDPENGYKTVPKKMTDAERQLLQQQHWSWLRYIVMCAFVGAALGVITVWLIIHFEIGGLGGMLARSGKRLAVTALLTAGFASTFGMIAMGVGIMIRSGKEDGKDQ